MKGNELKGGLSGLFEQSVVMFCIQIPRSQFNCIIITTSSIDRYFHKRLSIKVFVHCEQKTICNFCIVTIPTPRCGVYSQSLWFRYSLSFPFISLFILFHCLQLEFLFQISFFQLHSTFITLHRVCEIASEHSIQSCTLGVLSIEMDFSPSSFVLASFSVLINLFPRRVSTSY